MIVAVESNFVLELTFRQDEARHCDRLIELAREGVIQLVIPACSLFEPYETFVRRTQHRDYISGILRKELVQLARSEEYADLLETSQSVTRALAESGEVQGKALDATIDAIASVATVIPLTADVVKHALAVQLVYPLSRQDSVVFASVDKYMHEHGDRKKMFANKNRNDFLTPDIEAHFQPYDCKLLGSFAAARGFIEAALRRPV